MTRGQIAKATGCHAETIRYYEKTGLLPEPDRNHAGYRIYGDQHLRRLRFILRAKALGFPPADIKSLLTLSDDRDDHTRAEVKTLTESHIDMIREKISDLELLKTRLQQISSHCDGADESARDCPILTSLFSED